MVENYDRNCGDHHPGTTFHGIERVIASSGWNGKKPGYITSPYASIDGDIETNRFT